MECCWHNLGLVAVTLCFKCWTTTIMHINSLSRLMRLCKLIVEKIRNFYFKHLCALKVLCRFTENVNFNFVTANKKCLRFYGMLICSASYNWSSWNCKKMTHVHVCRTISHARTCRNREREFCRSVLPDVDGTQALITNFKICWNFYLKIIFLVEHTPQSLSDNSVKCLWLNRFTVLATQLYLFVQINSFS